MEKLALAAALLALTGCAACERHPKTCTAVVAVTAVGVGILLGKDVHNYTAERQYEVSKPLTPDCARLPEMCK